MASPLGILIDPVFEGHDTGSGHPERPARLASIRGTLEASGMLVGAVRVSPRAAADDELLAVHETGYLDRAARTCRSGEPFLDSMDTAVCPDSERIARLAAGGLCDLVAEVVNGTFSRGFAAVRPPGHHAERSLSMGFCIYNNVAVAARALQRRHGIERVLIVDWDVHHGNGTQHTFEDDPTVLFFSVHQMPLYPGTGAAAETGNGAGRGTTINRPLPPGAGDDAFLEVLSGDLSAAADAFRPEFVLVSAGFDAHEADPLGGLRVTTDAYAEASRIVRGIADRHAGGRMVSTLEGGYDLSALAGSVSAHLRVLAEDGAGAGRPGAAGR